MKLKPDAALAQHQHVLAQQVGHLLAGVKDRTGRLAHHPFVQGSFIGQRNHPVRARHDVLHQSAAAPGGNDDGPLALSEVVGAALHHHSGQLVAGQPGRHWILLFRMDLVSVADVASANRYPLQLNQALAVGCSRHLRIHKLEVFRSRQPRCFHPIIRLPS